MDQTSNFRDCCLAIDPSIDFSFKISHQVKSPVSKQHAQLLSIINESSPKPSQIPKKQQEIRYQRKLKAVKAPVFDSSDSEVEVENLQFQGMIKAENDLLLKELEQNYELITATTSKLMEINEMQNILTNTLDQQNEQMEGVFENSSQTVEVIAKGLEELRRNERDNKPKYWVLYLFISMSVILLAMDYMAS